MNVNDKLFNRVIEEGLEKEVQEIAKQYAGINVEDLPQLAKSPDELTEEEYNQLKGKVWFSTSDVYILYPIDDNSFVEFNSDGYVFYYTYNGTGESFECKTFVYIIPNEQQPKTQLFEHTITIGNDTFKVIDYNGGSYARTINSHQTATTLCNSIFANFIRMRCNGNRINALTISYMGDDTYVGFIHFAGYGDDDTAPVTFNIEIDFETPIVVTDEVTPL